RRTPRRIRRGSRNKVKDAKSGLFLDFREEGKAGEETDRKALRRRAHAVRFATKETTAPVSGDRQALEREKDYNDGGSGNLRGEGIDHVAGLYSARAKNNDQHSPAQHQEISWH